MVEHLPRMHKILGSIPSNEQMMYTCPQGELETFSYLAVPEPDHILGAPVSDCTWGTGSGDVSVCREE